MRLPTVVVVHRNAGVLELIEAATRSRGARVLGTLDPIEAVEIARGLKLDVLIVNRAQSDVVSAVRALQLDEIADVAAAALAARPQS